MRRDTRDNILTCPVPTSIVLMEFPRFSVCALSFTISTLLTGACRLGRERGKLLVQWLVVAGDQVERAILGQQTHGDAASFMILTIVASTSCATPSNCGAWNIASRVVGFKVAKIVLPPSS